MKKLFYLLFLLPLSLMVSCDKEDVQPFDMTLTLGGVTQVDNTFYTVAGDNVTIQNLTVQALGDKQTTVANVLFYVDDYLLFPDPWNVTGTLNFSTANLPVGIHNIGVTGNLLQVDQSIQNFVANYKLVIVENEEALPDGAPEIGSYSQTITFNK